MARQCVAWCLGRNCQLHVANRLPSNCSRGRSICIGGATTRTFETSGSRRDSLAYSRRRESKRLSPLPVVLEAHHQTSSTAWLRIGRTRQTSRQFQVEHPTDGARTSGFHLSAPTNDLRRRPVEKVAISRPREYQQSL